MRAHGSAILDAVSAIAGPFSDWLSEHGEHSLDQDSGWGERALTLLALGRLRRQTRRMMQPAGGDALARRS